MSEQLAQLYAGNPLSITEDDLRALELHFYYLKNLDHVHVRRIPTSGKSRQLAEVVVPATRSADEHVLIRAIGLDLAQIFVDATEYLPLFPRAVRELRQRPSLIEKNQLAMRSGHGETYADIPENAAQATDAHPGPWMPTDPRGDEPARPATDEQIAIVEELLPTGFSAETDPAIRAVLTEFRTLRAAILGAEQRAEERLRQERMEMYGLPVAYAPPFTVEEVVAAKQRISGSGLGFDPVWLMLNHLLFLMDRAELFAQREQVFKRLVDPTTGEPDDEEPAR